MRKPPVNVKNKDELTDRPTNQPNDRPTDIAGYRGACTRLKRHELAEYVFSFPTKGPLIQEKLGLLSNAMVKIAAGQETLEKLLSEEQSNHAKMESRSAETRNKAQMERGLMVKEQRNLNEELGDSLSLIGFDTMT